MAILGDPSSGRAMASYEDELRQLMDKVASIVWLETPDEDEECDALFEAQILEEERRKELKEALEKHHFELPPPPESLSERPETCKWHGRPEPRLDREPEWLNVGVKWELQFQGSTIHYQKRDEADRAAIASLKRQMREWPTCKFGGEVTIEWAYATIPGTWHIATWTCSHCSKL